MWQMLVSNAPSKPGSLKESMLHSYLQKESKEVQVKLEVLNLTDVTEMKLSFSLTRDLL